MVFKKTVQSEKLIFFPFLFFLAAAFFLFFDFLFLNLVKAQVPTPYVPCGDVRPNEFHSLRPYQASPCGEPPGSPPSEETALFCGNDLVVHDSVTVFKNTAERCENIAGGEERCYFRTENTTSIAINLSGAEFPVAGFTESDIGSAEKVNDYVSWYLNGVSNSPETGIVDPENEEDIYELVNFSGPLKRLLSWDSQAEARINTISEAGVVRHNQLIENDRIKDWEGNIAPSFLTRATTWNKKIPPLAKDFTDKPFIEYLKAYNEWRGKSCTIITIPVINIKTLACVGNPLRPTRWADNFQEIPLSSTEDRKGLVETNPAVPRVTGPGVTITELAFSNQEPAELFVPHMKEIVELGALLQKTFTSQGQEETGETFSSPSAPACDLAQIRYNPGDDLFAGEIAGELSYTAEFTCDFERVEETGSGIVCQDSGDCPALERCSDQIGRCVSDFVFDNPSCQKDIFANLSVVTKTPLADEAWQRFVIGPASIVKRIFPKISEGSPIAAFLDIPTVTKVQYTGEGLVSAGNTASERSGESAELYFPHVGSIHEYFLKGIQTALRPKGFGEPILSGQFQDTPTACVGTGEEGSYPDLPRASGACRLSLGGIGPFEITVPSELQKIIEAAADAYNVPASMILATMYTESNWSPHKPQSAMWSNENVKKWASGCAVMPNCNPDVFPNEYGGVIAWQTQGGWENNKDAVLVVDPGRDPNQCNLMDSIFAISKNLSTNHTGVSSFAGRSCFGIPLNAGSGRQNSCSWSNSAVETGYKMQSNGTADVCLTNPGSLRGGGRTAGCGPNFADNCETISSWSSGGGSSLNAGFWNMYQSAK